MTTRNIKIDKQAVRDMDLSELRPMMQDFPTRDRVGFSEAGIEAYKFYAYLSTQVDDSLIIEVGTRHGTSALAASYNPSNKVVSFDIQEQGASAISRPNLNFRIGNFMEDPTIPWGDVDIILIDVDPHDGIKEREFIAFLESKQWEGLLVLDDVLPTWPANIRGANPAEMFRWWNELEYEKWELSEIGHYSGTGLVNVGNKFTVDIV